jgi:hypothetical protein
MVCSERDAASAVCLNLLNGLRVLPTSELRRKTAQDAIGRYRTGFAGFPPRFCRAGGAQDSAEVTDVDDLVTLSIKYIEGMLAKF